MFYAFLSAIPSLKPIPFILDGMVEAQARVSKEQINAKSMIITVNGAAESNFVIDVIRNREARINVKASPIQPQDEIYYYKVNGDKAVAYAYHPSTGQFTQSDGANTNLGGFIKAATPHLDDFIIGLIVPSGLIETRKRLDVYNSKWSMTTRNGQIMLKYKQKDASNEITVNQKDLRLRKAAFSNGAGGIIWNISYAPIKPIKAPPQEVGAYQVAQFDELIGDSKTASTAAKSTLQKLYTKYEQPDLIAYTVNTDGETTTVSYSNSYAYQSDNLATWGYDGKTLAILNKTTGKYYTGPATREELIQAVAATGSRVEINLRSLIVGRNPYRLLLNDFTNVKPGKTETVSGESAEVLGANSIFAELKISVAKKDGFVLKVESTPVTNTGQKLPKSVSTYKRIKGENLKVSAPSNVAKLPLNDLLR